MNNFIQKTAILDLVKNNDFPVKNIQDIEIHPNEQIQTALNQRFKLMVDNDFYVRKSIQKNENYSFGPRTEDEIEKISQFAPIGTKFWRGTDFPEDYYNVDNIGLSVLEKVPENIQHNLKIIDKFYNNAETDISKASQIIEFKNYQFIFYKNIGLLKFVYFKNDKEKNVSLINLNFKHQNNNININYIFNCFKTFINNREIFILCTNDGLYHVTGVNFNEGINKNFVLYVNKIELINNLNIKKNSPNLNNFNYLNILINNIQYNCILFIDDKIYYSEWLLQEDTEKINLLNSIEWPTKQKDFSNFKFFNFLENDKFKIIIKDTNSNFYIFNNNQFKALVDKLDISYDDYCSLTEDIYLYYKSNNLLLLNFSKDFNISKNITISKNIKKLKIFNIDKKYQILFIIYSDSTICFKIIENGNYETLLENFEKNNIDLNISNKNVFDIFMIDDCFIIFFKNPNPEPECFKISYCFIDKSELINFEKDLKFENKYLLSSINDINKVVGFPVKPLLNYWIKIEDEKTENLLKFKDEHFDDLLLENKNKIYFLNEKNVFEFTFSKKDIIDTVNGKLILKDNLNNIKFKLNENFIDVYKDNDNDLEIIITDQSLRIKFPNKNNFKEFSETEIFKIVKIKSINSKYYCFKTSGIFELKIDFLNLDINIENFNILNNIYKFETKNSNLVPKNLVFCPDQKLYLVQLFFQENKKLDEVYYSNSDIEYLLNNNLGQYINWKILKTSNENFSQIEISKDFGILGLSNNNENNLIQYNELSLSLEKKEDFNLSNKILTKYFYQNSVEILSSIEILDNSQIEFSIGNKVKTFYDFNFLSSSLKSLYINDNSNIYFNTDNGIYKYFNENNLGIIPWLNQKNEFKNIKFMCDRTESNFDSLIYLTCDTVTDNKLSIYEINRKNNDLTQFGYSEDKHNIKWFDLNQYLLSVVELTADMGSTTNKIIGLETFYDIDSNNDKTFLIIDNSILSSEKTEISNEFSGFDDNFYNNIFTKEDKNKEKINNFLKNYKFIYFKQFQNNQYFYILSIENDYFNLKNKDNKIDKLSSINFNNNQKTKLNLFFGTNIENLISKTISKSNQISVQDSNLSDYYYNLKYNEQLTSINVDFNKNFKIGSPYVNLIEIDKNNFNSFYYILDPKDGDFYYDFSPLFDNLQDSKNNVDFYKLEKSFYTTYTAVGKFVSLYGINDLFDTENVLILSEKYKRSSAYYPTNNKQYEEKITFFENPYVVNEQIEIEKDNVNSKNILFKEIYKNLINNNFYIDLISPFRINGPEKTEITLENYNFENIITEIKEKFLKFTHDTSFRPSTIRLNDLYINNLILIGNKLIVNRHFNLYKSGTSKKYYYENFIIYTLEKENNFENKDQDNLFNDYYYYPVSAKILNLTINEKKLFITNDDFENLSIVNDNIKLFKFLNDTIFCLFLKTITNELFYYVFSDLDDLDDLENFKEITIDPPDNTIEIQNVYADYSVDDTIFVYCTNNNIYKFKLKFNEEFDEYEFEKQTENLKSFENINYFNNFKLFYKIKQTNLITFCPNNNGKTKKTGSPTYNNWNNLFYYYKFLNNFEKTIQIDDDQILASTKWLNNLFFIIKTNNDKYCIKSFNLKNPTELKKISEINFLSNLVLKNNGEIQSFINFYEKESNKIYFFIKLKNQLYISNGLDIYDYESKYESSTEETSDNNLINFNTNITINNDVTDESKLLFISYNFANYIDNKNKYNKEIEFVFDNNLLFYDEKNFNCYQFILDYKNLFKQVDKNGNPTYKFKKLLNLNNIVFASDETSYNYLSGSFDTINDSKLQFKNPFFIQLSFDTLNDTEKYFILNDLGSKFLLSAESGLYQFNKNFEKPDKIELQNKISNIEYKFQSNDIFYLKNINNNIKNIYYLLNKYYIFLNEYSNETKTETEQNLFNLINFNLNISNFKLENTILNNNNNNISFNNFKLIFDKIYVNGKNTETDQLSCFNLKINTNNLELIPETNKQIIFFDNCFINKNNIYFNNNLLLFETFLNNQNIDKINNIILISKNNNLIIFTENQIKKFNLDIISTGIFKQISFVFEPNEKSKSEEFNSNNINIIYYLNNNKYLLNNKSNLYLFYNKDENIFDFNKQYKLSSSNDYLIDKDITNFKFIPKFKIFGDSQKSISAYLLTVENKFYYFKSNKKDFTLDNSSNELSCFKYFELSGVYASNYIKDFINLNNDEYKYLILSDNKLLNTDKTNNLQITHIFDKITKNEIIDNYFKNILNEHIKNKHIINNSSETIIKSLNNKETVDFNSFDKNKWNKTEFFEDENLSLSVENDLVETFEFLDNSFKIMTKIQNFTTNNEFNSIDNSCIIKKYFSGIKEFYIYLPTTNTYYVDLTNKDTNLKNNIYNLYNPVGNFSNSAIFGNIENGKTILKVYINKNEFSENSTILNININGNSLPLNIFKNYNNDDIFSSIIMPSTVDDSTFNENLEINEENDYKIFKFIIFGTDAQSIKISII